MSAADRSDSTLESAPQKPGAHPTQNSVAGVMTLRSADGKHRVLPRVFIAYGALISAHLPTTSQEKMGRKLMRAFVGLRERPPLSRFFRRPSAEGDETSTAPIGFFVEPAKILQRYATRHAR